MGWVAAIPAIMGALQAGQSQKDARSQNRIEAEKTRQRPFLGTMGNLVNGDGGAAMMGGIGGSISMYQNQLMNEELRNKYDMGKQEASMNKQPLAINTNPYQAQQSGYVMQGPQRYDPYNMA